GAMTANSSTNPTAWSAAITANMAATVRHCPGVSPPLTRAQRETWPVDPTAAPIVTFLVAREWPAGRRPAERTTVASHSQKAGTTTRWGSAPHDATAVV